MSLFRPVHLKHITALVVWYKCIPLRSLASTVGSPSTACHPLPPGHHSSYQMEQGPSGGHRHVGVGPLLQELQHWKNERGELQHIFVPHCEPEGAAFHACLNPKQPWKQRRCTNRRPTLFWGFNLGSVSRHTETRFLVCQHHHLFQPVNYSQRGPHSYNLLFQNAWLTLLS